MFKVYLNMALFTESTIKTLSISAALINPDFIKTAMISPATWSESASSASTKPSMCQPSSSVWSKKSTPSRSLKMTTVRRSIHKPRCDHRSSTFTCRRSDSCHRQIWVLAAATKDCDSFWTSISKCTSTRFCSAWAASPDCDRRTERFRASWVWFGTTTPRSFTTISMGTTLRLTSWNMSCLEAIRSQLASLANF